MPLQYMYMWATLWQALGFQISSVTKHFFGSVSSNCKKRWVVENVWWQNFMLDLDTHKRKRKQYFENREGNETNTVFINLHVFSGMDLG